MQITPTNQGLANARVTLTSPAAGEQDWQAGQILEAVVVSADHGTLTLRIGNLLVQAQTQSPLKPGQTLNLQVLKAGVPPVLQLVPEESAPDPALVALRSALPRQDGLPPLLANLAQLAQTTGGRAQLPLPAPSAQAGEQVFNHLPGVETVTTPRGLRQALLDSGLFLENRLAQALSNGQPPNLDADLKAGLIRLLTTLTGARPSEQPATSASAATADRPVPTPPPLRGAPVTPQARSEPNLAAHLSSAQNTNTLAHQVESGLARIQLGQLASVPSTPDARPLWMLELPVRNGSDTNVFHLQIDQEGSRGGRDAPTPMWSVTLAFDLAALGPVRARVTVVDKQVSVGIWTEHESTAQLFDRHLQTLGTRLQESGLRVGHLTCQTGAPQQPEPDPNTDNTNPLLSVKA